jgi:hypothetical protein
MRGSTGSEGRRSPSKAALDLSQFRASYKKADDFCKEVQSFSAQAGIPAMNELRYAGHHLLEALADDGSLQSGDQLGRAINHAKRACYEAGEAGILIALDEIDKFKSDFKDIAVTSVVKDYLEILKAADVAKDRVVAQRDHAGDGQLDHDDFIKHFQTLKSHCRTLEHARSELNKIAANERKIVRRWIAGIVIAVLGILVAAVLKLVQG